MEKRLIKVNISTAGGTAGVDSKTYKISLPNSWIQQLGITGDERELEMSFDGECISLRRHLSAEMFAKNQKSQEHSVKVLKFYDKEQLCSTIYMDFTTRSLQVENHCDNLTKTAFGKNKLPVWEDLMSFLEERCIPQGRAGLREYLESHGLQEYDPWQIIKKTQGRMAEDQQWLSMEELE